MPVTHKVGRMSPADKKKIIELTTAGKTAAEIGAELNRTVETIERFLADHVKPKVAPNAPKVDAEKAQRIVVRQGLRSSRAWKNLKEEFSDDELEYFEEGYIKLMTQLTEDGGGVRASEETQVFQLIKFEILMSRNLRERKKCLADIDRLTKVMGTFMKKFGGDPSKMDDDDRIKAQSMNTELNIAKQGEQNRTNEYVKLHEGHVALSRTLKSTRDQRVKEFEKTGVDYLSIIKSFERKDVQKRDGRQMELIKLAGQNAGRQLGELIPYEDGTVDRPILSADTVDQVDGPEERAPNETEGATVAGPEDKG